MSLVIDLLVIALTTAAGLVLGRRLWRDDADARAAWPRMIGNRRAVVAGGAVALLAVSVSAAQGQLLGGVLAAVFLAPVVAAVVDRLVPAR